MKKLLIALLFAGSFSAFAQTDLETAFASMVVNDLSAGTPDAIQEDHTTVQDGVLVKMPTPQLTTTYTNTYSVLDTGAGEAFPISHGAVTGTVCNVLADGKTLEFPVAMPKGHIGLTLQAEKSAGGSAVSMDIWIKFSTDGGSTYNSAPFARWNRTVSPSAQSDRYVAFPVFNIQAGWLLQFWARAADANIDFAPIAADVGNDVPGAPSVRVDVKL